MINLIKKIFQTKVVLREFDDKQNLKKEIILQGDKKEVEEIINKFINKSKFLKG